MPSLYSLLPTYARLIDEANTKNALQRFCAAVEAPVEDFKLILDNFQYFFDPQLTPPDFLDWSQQIYGWAPIDGKWLGLGLNPDWPVSRKRFAIANAWNYNLLKGSEKGIRLAYAIWLGLTWAQDDSLKLRINLPLGSKPTAFVPGWWDYATTFDSQLCRTYIDRQNLGAGDWIGQETLSSWRRSHNPQDINTWPTIQSNWKAISDPVVLSGQASCLSHKRPWTHLFLTPQEWVNVFPAIQELNFEVWEASTFPVVFGWRSLQLPTTALAPIATAIATPDLIQETFVFDGFLYNLDLLSVWDESGEVNTHIQYSSGELLDYTRTIIITPDTWLLVYAGLQRIIDGDITLLLQSESGKLYTVPLSTAFWSQGTQESSARSPFFNVDEGYTKLWVEFAYEFDASDVITAVQLAIGTAIVYQETNVYAHPIDNHFGWRFIIPITLADPTLPLPCSGEPLEGADLILLTGSDDAILLSAKPCSISTDGVLLDTDGIPLTDDQDRFLTPAEYTPAPRAIEEGVLLDTEGRTLLGLRDYAALTEAVNITDPTEDLTGTDDATLEDTDGNTLTGYEP